MKIFEIEFQFNEYQTQTWKTSQQTSVHLTINMKINEYCLPSVHCSISNIVFFFPH